MNFVASIIIPIRVKNLYSDGTRRLRFLLKTIPENFEIIVVDDGSSTKAKAYIEYLCDKYNNAKYEYMKTKMKKFSLARARNQGIKLAAADVIILHDVDFLASTYIYEKISQEIKNKQLAVSPENFFCVPIAFLTQKGTQKYLHDFKKEINFEYWSFLNHSAEPCDNVNFIVSGSSCIVCNKNILLTIGGHDERYTGHGAEDFELLHRLSKLYPKAELPANYSLNTKSGSIKEYKGFRAYFALYGHRCVSLGIVLVHLYHPKRPIVGYYKHKRNFKMLKKLMDKDYNLP